MARAMWGASVLILLLWLVACATPTVLPTPTLAPTVMLVASPVPSRAPTSVTPVSPVPILPRPSITPPPLVVAPSRTPRPHQFDRVDSRALLNTLFPDLKLAPFADAFTVNDDTAWQLWITSRAEGQFVQGVAPELATIVAHQAPHLTPDLAQKYAPMSSFLVLFEKRDGKVVPAYRAFLSPADFSPLVFQMTIEQATDFDQDEQNELLIVTRASRMGITTIAGFLYQWDDAQFVERWSAGIGMDNTSALNQAAYVIADSAIELADLDHDGFDEIIVETTRIEYAKDDQGLANLERTTMRQTTRQVFRWDGSAFVRMP